MCLYSPRSVWKPGRSVARADSWVRSRRWCPGASSPRGGSTWGSRTAESATTRGRLGYLATPGACCGDPRARPGRSGRLARNGIRPRSRSRGSLGWRSSGWRRSSVRAGTRTDFGRPDARSGSSRDSRGEAGRPAMGIQTDEVRLCLLLKYSRIISLNRQSRAIRV